MQIKNQLVVSRVAGILALFSLIILAFTSCEGLIFNINPQSVKQNIALGWTIHKGISVTTQNYILSGVITKTEASKIVEKLEIAKKSLEAAEELYNAGSVNDANRTWIVVNGLLIRLNNELLIKELKKGGG